MRRISVTGLVLLSTTWLVLAGTGAGAWIAGLLAVAFATLLHVGLGGAGDERISLHGALGFFSFFLGQSLRGGMDVAYRALSPSLPLAPTFLHYSMRLPTDAARVLFLNTISLLPGTFSARVDGSDLTIHLLAHDASGLDRVRRLEDRVARIFGHDLDPGPEVG